VKKSNTLSTCYQPPNRKQGGKEVSYPPPEGAGGGNRKRFHFFELFRFPGFLIIIVLWTVLLGGCYHPSPQEAFNDLKAIKGKWESTGQTLFNEQWQVVSDTLMTGTGFSMNGKDTAFSELLKIIRIGDTVWYAARPNPKKDDVFFKLEEAGHRHWTFKNPENEYPGIIRYELKEDTILLTRTTNIRGNKEIVFTFKKTVR